MYNKKFILSHLISITKPLVLCIQECFFLSDETVRSLNAFFDDYFIYYKNRVRVGTANPGGGVAILVHKTVPHTLLPLNTALEAIAINVKHANKDVSICSLYVPQPRLISLEQLNHLSSQLNDHRVIMGDFNAHHPSWGSLRVDSAGQMVSNFITLSDNVLLNTGEPTRICPANGTPTHIDLTLASPRLSLDI